MSSVNARTVVPAAAVPVVAKSKNRVADRFFAPLKARDGPAEAKFLMGEANKGLVRGHWTLQVLHVHCREPIRPARLDIESGFMVVFVVGVALGDG